MTKEEIYDADIAPLMDKIIAACRRGNIDFAASFALDEGAGDGPLMCSTVIIADDSLPGSSRLLQKNAGSHSRKHGTPCDGLYDYAGTGRQLMAQVIVDYDPLRDAPPGATGIRTGRTPQSAARKLRGLWIAGNVFPLTFVQHVQMRPTLDYRMDFSKSGQKAQGSVGAFAAVWWTAVDAGCSMAEAREAVEATMPELYADHWEEEWQKIYRDREAAEEEKREVAEEENSQ